MSEENMSNLNEDPLMKQAQQSGLTYNQAKEFIAKTTGGHGTNIYSNTNVEEVKRKNQESMDNRTT
ncbi:MULTISPECIES: hypothetical protein [Virgibacillus]|uniref:hypothetical protein n=1 Tax=Virgibacillus TaxID=84406 RepID=UPI00045D04C1|nr:MULTISPECIES: hypothetical protein [Virgibacillus]AIF43124.1 hypothetical protein X953_08130 [Virgibacillus sp. SK37]CDQ37638.1 hypothetical protein BN993_07198 [Virgibacillus halodenitrificans]